MYDHSSPPASLFIFLNQNLLSCFSSWINQASNIFVKYFTRCFYFFRYLSICLVSLKFFMLSIFIMCSENFSSLFLTAKIRFSVVSIFIKTSLFHQRYLNDILRIFRLNLNSFSSSLLFIFVMLISYSLPYCSVYIL